MTSSVSMSAEQFFDGLAIALGLEGINTICIRDKQFDKAVASVFRHLESQAKEKGWRLRFRIRTNRIHGDSPTLRHAITDAAQRDIVSLDNPEFLDIRIKLRNEAAESYLEYLPAGPGLYHELAREFKKNYDLVE